MRELPRAEFEPFVATIFRPHAFGLVMQGASALHALSTNPSVHDRVCKEMILGLHPGLVCARCGLSVEEVVLASCALEQAGWSIPIVPCIVRPTSVAKYRRDGGWKLGDTLYDALSTLRGSKLHQRAAMMTARGIEASSMDCFTVL
jgi:hypothetical protein